MARCSLSRIAWMVRPNGECTMRHSRKIANVTVSTVKTWNESADGNSGRGTSCNPFSPPVIAVAL